MMRDLSGIESKMCHIGCLGSECHVKQAKESQLEQLSARLQAVQLEKQRLEQQNKLLESALVARVMIAADKEPAQPLFASTSEQKVGLMMFCTSILPLRQHVQGFVLEIEI